MKKHLMKFMVMAVALAGVLASQSQAASPQRLHQGAPVHRVVKEKQKKHAPKMAQKREIKHRDNHRHHSHGLFCALFGCN